MGEAMRFEVISFDADGTLVDHQFSHIVWFEKIPERYAEKNGLGIDDARSELFGQFGMVGDENPDWFSLDYWFDRLGLGDTSSFMGDIEGLVILYPEVEEVLEMLGSEHRLIVTSNAPKEFLDIELRSIEGRFDQIYSVPSDLHMVKKDPRSYQKVCSLLGVETREVVHVGDRWHDDVDSPLKAGITAIHLDREYQGKNDSVPDLKEFGKRVLEIEGNGFQ